MKQRPSEPHLHKDEDGHTVFCYHRPPPLWKRALWWAVGLTTTFPLEHALWEKVPPFRWLAHAWHLL